MLQDAIEQQPSMGGRSAVEADDVLFAVAVKVLGVDGSVEYAEPPPLSRAAIRCAAGIETWAGSPVALMLIGSKRPS